MKSCLSIVSMKTLQFVLYNGAVVFRKKKHKEQQFLHLWSSIFNISAKILMKVTARLHSCFQSWFVCSHPLSVGYIAYVLISRSLLNISDYVLSPRAHLTVSLIATYIWHITNNFWRTVRSFYFLFSQIIQFCIWIHKFYILAIILQTLKSLATFLDSLP